MNEDSYLDTFMEDRLSGSSQPAADGARAGVGVIRQASPQAWRRVRKAIGKGEAADLAADILAVIERDDFSSVADAIAWALSGEPWDEHKQG